MSHLSSWVAIIRIVASGSALCNAYPAVWLALLAVSAFRFESFPDRHRHLPLVETSSQIKVQGGLKLLHEMR